MTTTNKNFIELGREVIAIEAEAVQGMLQQLDHNFTAACELLLGCKGRIVVIGMGKSGHIGGKIAATLASTGSPAFFVHPAEASHGDLGMITRDDVIIALSNSGETFEVTQILPVIKLLQVKLVAITGNADSSLAKASDAHLHVDIKREACPLNLAPTASTTAALVMGDALAVALLEARGFTPEDFALSHPGGSLGRRLLLRLNDLMHDQENIPKVSQDTSIKDALLEISSKRLGMTTIVDEAGKLLGIYTDGDLRRTLDQGLDLAKIEIAQVMTRNPKTVDSQMLAAEALTLMEKHAITVLVVTDQEKHPIGVVHMHDLLKSGLGS